MSATIEFDDGLIKSFTSTITSYTNYDDKNINFEFYETEKVTATMNKGTREKSTSLPNFSIKVKQRLNLVLVMLFLLI